MDSKAPTNLERLFAMANELYSNGDPAHDLIHIQRVVANCRRLGGRVGANLKLLLPAAILHDVVNLPKNHPQRLEASRLAAEKSATLLQECGYSANEIKPILQIITEHSYSRGLKPSSLESAVLQDADKLDALGAIGIMRTVSCGSQMGASYYSLEEPIAPARRVLDDRKYTIDHFFTKLFKLPDLMNTAAAKEEAHERVHFIRAFLDQLGREML